MVNFSISVFYNVLSAQPSYSNLDVTLSRKMIKCKVICFRKMIKFKVICFWKLDLDIFPTIYGTYFYHFQIIPVNSLKLVYVQLPTLPVLTLFHSLVRSFQSVHVNCTIQDYLTRNLILNNLPAGGEVQIMTFSNSKIGSKLKGRKRPP